VIKRALNYFDNTTYQKHVKVRHSKSVGQATKATTVTEMLESVHEVDLLTFNIAKAKKAVPDYDWDLVTPIFSVEARQLWCYVVEVLMFPIQMHKNN
jgi:hypothetical protein